MSDDAAAPAPPLRLLVVDDQPLIRRGLSLMLAIAPGIEVVGQAADGVDAVEQALALAPDVVIMDLRMPRRSGVIATREIVQRCPATRIVVLSTYDDDELVFEALRAGAQAYLLKDATEDEVLDTVRAVSRGEARLSPAIARKVIHQFRDLAGRLQAAPGAEAAPTQDLVAAPHDAALTAREVRILDLIAQGHSNKQIAATVFLAEGTVKNYVSRILDKLQARNRVELARRHAAARTDGHG